MFDLKLKLKISGGMFLKEFIKPLINRPLDQHLLD